MPIKQNGVVAVELPTELPAEAGNLTKKEVKGLAKPRKGFGLAAEKTAEAMVKYPHRLGVPGISPEQLVEAAKRAEAVKGVIIDLQVTLKQVKQASLLLNAEAFLLLRRVIAFVRSQEKFDPLLSDLVPNLIAYFAAPVVVEEEEGEDGEEGDETDSDADADEAEAEEEAEG